MAFFLAINVIGDPSLIVPASIYSVLMTIFGLFIALLFGRACSKNATARLA
jgi:predicted Na+-dependent transporter